MLRAASTRRSTSLLALLAAGALLACGGSTGPEGGPPPETASSFRLVNGSPFALSVVIDGAVVARDVASGEYTNPIPLGEAGPVSLLLRRSSGAGTAETPVTFESEGGLVHVVAAMGGSGLPVAARALADTNAQPVAGRAKLRVVHLAAEAPPVDIWYEAPGTGVAARVMFPFSPGEESPYLQQIPGTWRVWATPQHATAPVLAEANVPVGSGAVRTVALLPSSEGLVLRAFDDR